MLSIRAMLKIAKVCSLAILPEAEPAHPWRLLRRARLSSGVESHFEDSIVPPETRATIMPLYLSGLQFIHLWKEAQAAITALRDSMLKKTMGINDGANIMMPAHKTLSDEIILFFCRLGFAGLAPRAPGTWGTAVACILAPFLFLPLNLGWRAALLAILFILGGFAATRAEEILGQKDPGQVVIDELVGVWLAMLPFQKAGFWTILAAFICFRIFDIAKPWPIKASEDWLPDGFGVMLDDVLAGVMAMACVYALRLLGIA